MEGVVAQLLQEQAPTMTFKGRSASLRVPGTSPMLAASQVKSAHESDFSESMVNVFKVSVRTEGLQNIEIHCGDSQAIPFSDEMFDVAFSMFGIALEYLGDQLPPLPTTRAARAWLGCGIK